MGWVIVGSRAQYFRFWRLVAAASLFLAYLVYLGQAHAVDLPNRFLQLSTSLPGVAATYKLGFDTQAGETIGSIELQFCANSPLFGQPCTAPAGFDISNAVLSGQTGETGFTIDVANTTANTLVLTRVPAATSTGSSTYTLDNVMNPTTVDSFYGRLQTFATIDASGSPNDQSGLAMSIDNAVQVSATVPPYLLFCSGITITGFDCNTASGDYINFGNLVSGATASAQSEMVTATNAANGYMLQVTGSTMTSGNNTISPMAVRDVSRPTVSQFGMNLAANTTPDVGADVVGPGTAAPTADYSQADFFKFLSGDTIATATGVQDFRKLTASYIINIPSGQPIGIYVTTLTYICTANF